MRSRKHGSRTQQQEQSSLQPYIHCFLNVNTLSTWIAFKDLARLREHPRLQHSCLGGQLPAPKSPHPISLHSDCSPLGAASTAGKYRPCSLASAFSTKSLKKLLSEAVGRARFPTTSSGCWPWRWKTPLEVGAVQLAMQSPVMETKNTNFAVLYAKQGIWMQQQWERRG